MKIAIFDMDGTLIDSMPLWKDVAGCFCEDRGLRPEKDLTDLFHKMTIPQAAAYFKEEYRLVESETNILKDLQGYAMNAYAEKVPAKAGVKEALQVFAEAGIRMAIATANERTLVEIVLKRLDLFSCISSIHTCTEVGAAKKDSPAVFEACFKDLKGQLRTEAYVFEDAPHAAISAKKGGFTVVGVYDASYQKEHNILKNNSDYFFYHAHEWISLLA